MLQRMGKPSYLMTPPEKDLVYPTMAIALSRVLDLGIEEAPKEACGLLIQEGLEEIRVIQLRNRSDDPNNSYRIDPDTLRSLALKPKQWAHVAIWHTHPGGLVGPSAGDLEYKVPSVKYVVVAIPTGEASWF